MGRYGNWVFAVRSPGHEVLPVDRGLWVQGYGAGYDTQPPFGSPRVLQQHSE